MTNLNLQDIVVGYAKFFSMSGAGAYYSCNICLMKATRLNTKMAMLGHRNFDDIPTREYLTEVNEYIISFCRKVNSKPEGYGGPMVLVL